MNMTEGSTIEFKRIYVNDIAKTAVAFANTKGGRIYIGIEDDGTVAGIDDADDVMLKCTNNLRDSIKPDITLFSECRMENIEGKDVIVLEIQKGTASPYYIASKGIRPEGVFVRQGSSNVPATETAILKMIKETDGDEYEDVRSLDQNLTFLEAVKVFDNENIPFGLTQQKTLGIINTDGVYSNLGLLISDQCVHTIKVAVFEGTEKLVFKDRTEFTGSLLKQLSDVFEMLGRYNRTHSEFGGLYRVDTRDYPIEAIREVLLNALVHRDYSFSGSILISIFDDRIEVVSLGGLVKGITYDDIMLGASIPRNKKLANLFYRLKLIEAYGTGMPKIISCYKECYTKPMMEVSDNAFKITLPNMNLAGKEIMTGSLTVKEKACYELFKGERELTRKQVESSLTVSQPFAVKILNGLVDKNLIDRVGKGKNTRYELK
ncbi:RNA-binding domain-containing protein [Aminicella lysinilytica]|uniref:ATP-dependent DNA helicase RecG n=1 Tax=Aminicella lysinilytica TaxID=433323 RepID=A0A4R6Q4I8_9FIRM|nr:RNA-binding domain-containing protein [Aminicella lysinilytica]TDP57278.1 ATP-dependent DNA helicase RecG [Aminicella lysinilytica]